MSNAPAVIETRPLSSLRAHPENAVIFGDPEESEQYESILASIRKHGVWEPLVIKRDGTILSGHLRRAAALACKLTSVPVRIADDFGSYREELEFVIRSNTDRRQLTKGEIALAFKRLRETPRAEGGTKGQRGGDRKSAGAKNQSSASGQLIDVGPTRDPGRGDEDAADVLGIGKHEARALETVFTTPGVPEQLKRAVNSGAIAATPAAKAVRSEVKRQGGEIKDSAPLAIVAQPKPKASAQPPSSHEQRMADGAEKFRKDFRELFELYTKLDGILSRRPLRTVIGTSEHHEYSGLIRDVALRAWREIESVEGTTNAGRQMALSVVRGGQS